MTFDLKNIVPSSSIAPGGFFFGADSQSNSAPQVYPASILTPTASVEDTLASFIADMPSIPATVKYVTVQNVNFTAGGTPPSGAYIASLTYKRAASSSGIYGEQSSGGVYWVPQYSTSPVNCCEFGAIGDGTYNLATGAIAGTDSTAFIQAALDFAMQNNYPDVHLPDGGYVTNDTIQLGYGDAYRMIRLVGSYRNGYTRQGTFLFPKKTDRPAIACQGNYYGKISGIAIFGQNYVFGLAMQVANTFSATDSDWIDPALIPAGTNPGGLQQHSPYCAIALDPYSNAAPADAYPAVTYPAWTGLSTQYNKNNSTDTLIEDVFIAGFGVGIIAKPNGDNNCDFTKIHNVLIYSCPYSVAICHGQSRNVDFSNIQCSNAHTFLTTLRFGLGQGQLGGPISNIGAGHIYQFFDINTSTVGAFKASFVYGEDFVRVGNFSGSTVNAPIIFESCNFNLGASVIHGIHPSGYIEVNTNPATTFILDGCTISGSARIANLIVSTGAQPLVMVRGGLFFCGSSFGGASGTVAQMNALNWCGGVFLGASMPCVAGFVKNFRFDGNVQMYVLATPTSALNEIPYSEDLQISNNARKQITAYTRYFNDMNGRQWHVHQNQTPGKFILMTDVGIVSVAPVLTNDVLTFTYVDFYQSHPVLFTNIEVGDILYHDNSGTIFLVTAIGAQDGSSNWPITAQQQNNLVLNTSTDAYVSNLIAVSALNTGYVVLHKTAPRYMNNTIYWGTFTSGSTSVTNVQRGDGYGGDATNFLSGGDTLDGWTLNDAGSSWPVGPATTINTVTNGSPGSLTLNQNAVASGRFPICGVPIT